MTGTDTDENAYQALSETTAQDDPRWAFGTGMDDELAAEITAAVPDGADPADLASYCLMLGDDALVVSHRLSEWVSNAFRCRSSERASAKRSNPASTSR